eukprot:8571322-Alexandrium_andersonii.AAC.1
MLPGDEEAAVRGVKYAFGGEADETWAPRPVGRWAGYGGSLGPPCWRRPTWRVAFSCILA